MNSIDVVGKREVYGGRFANLIGHASTIVYSKALAEGGSTRTYWTNEETARLYYNDLQFGSAQIPIGLHYKWHLSA
jgi:hypothetical protein